MAARSKKGFKDSIDDVLGDLLGEDDPPPTKPRKSSPLTSAPINRTRSSILSSTTTKKSLLDDNFFSQLAKEVEEESDVSEADPQALLEGMKDMDDMDAEIFGGRKPSSAPAKDFGMSRSVDVKSSLEDKTSGAKRGHSAPESDKKPLATTAGPTRPYKKFSFDDLDDPLAGILSDEDEGVVKKTKTTTAKLSQESSPARRTDAPLPSPVKPTPAPRKKDELTFEEDSDDIMAALGIGDSPQGPQKEEGSASRPARAKLDELLGRGTAAKLLERPPTGEKREFKLDPKYQKQPEKEDPLGDEDFAFGSYQPTLAASPEGRPSRRASVRFSADSGDNVKSDVRSHPSTPMSRSPARGEKNGADWLGLKDEDVLDLTPPGPLKDTSQTPAVTPVLTPTVTPALTTSHPSSAIKPVNGPTSQLKAGQTVPTTVPQEDDGWLATALSRKKAQKHGEEERVRGQSAPAETLVTSTPTAPLSSSRQTETNSVRETAPAARITGSPLPWEAPKHMSAPATPVIKRREETPSAVSSDIQEPRRAPPQHPTSSRTSERWVREGDEELLQAQNRVMELEAQVRKLQLERDQQNLLLETLQQRQREDVELIESAHRSRLKLVEDSAQQREERLRLEIQDLSAQYLSRCHTAERDKAELQAQYQKKLTEFQQEKEVEVERIRELQRISVREMSKDHEQQLQRLKRIKDQEIDAVTSASSHTRSLNGVIEQMESFSHKLSDLSHQVESTQLSTTQDLEIGTRQREGQLRALQERLTRQQRDMEEERNSLRSVITNMETRLSEQSRLLEQERWRVSAEQAKVESLQRSLEEQRRVMTQQMALEREELERAKSALLEEQQSVMARCAEERRKLAAEWAEFHTQHKLSMERAERDISRAMMVDTHREGAIISLAKEQAELKIQASELRIREEQLKTAQEALEKERQELRLEKERVNASALRVKNRAEEIESMSKLALDRYEEGDKALAEAQRVESEHQNRLRAIQQKLERLRQQEEHLHQERVNMAQQRRQLNQLRQGLPTASALLPVGPQEPPLTLPLGPGPSSALGLSSTQITLPHIAAVTSTPRGMQEDGAVQASEFHAKLAQLKFYAQRDRDFLEDEQIFLENLKKSSTFPWSQTV
ncbi:fas-binding factor 1 isoform 2-T4 [Discoglossus pictus]